MHLKRALKRTNKKIINDYSEQAAGKVKGNIGLALQYLLSFLWRFLLRPEAGYQSLVNIA